MHHESWLLILYLKVSVSAAKSGIGGYDKISPKL